MDPFADYSHALASLALWAILVSMLGGISTFGRSSDRAPCGKPIRNYSNPAYRRERAFQNAVEGAGPFIAATIAAILVGAPPFWVNLIASIFLVARLATAAVHILTTNQLLRSGTWFVGLVCITALAILALVGAFS